MDRSPMAGTGFYKISIKRAFIPFRMGASSYKKRSD
jgi:hypothetical protein